MYGPDSILGWLEAHVHSMRRSRMKTLAAVASAAMRMKGVGVLALGRAMSGEVGAKHCIKRVWRFFRNPDVETEAVSRALFGCLAPREGPCVVLVDWTDLSPFQQLVFSLPRDGRSLPFWSRTIPKAGGEGSMVRAENEALEALERLAGPGRRLVLVADRGFGNTRWLGAVGKRGWGFVQRIAGTVSVDVPAHWGALRELPLRRGEGARNWGWGRLSEAHPLPIRLVTGWAESAKEPWYLATNLDEPPAGVVRIYQRRMWIEETFRDLKNRQWGLGLDAVRLSEPERHDRLFLVLALAYAFLCAFGAAAETLEVDRLLKANTANERVMNLARMGNYFLQLAHCSVEFALQTLNALPP